MTRRRAAWSVALSLTFLAEISVWTTGRDAEQLYMGEGTWIVVHYAEPWRTVGRLFAVAMVSAFVARAALSSGERSRGHAIAAGCAMLLSVAMSIELASATYFDDIQGDILVGTLFVRATERLPMGETGWCARANFASPFVWRLNGRNLYPRVLPLPITSETLIRRLSQRSEGCPRPE